MKKFFVLFYIPVAVMDDWKAKTDSGKIKKMNEDMQAEWLKWMDDHQKSFVEKGLPLGKTKRVTSKGALDARNDLTWYSIVEADSHEAAAKLFESHPHLQIPQSYIEILEIRPAGV